MTRIAKVSTWFSAPKAVQMQLIMSSILLLTTLLATFRTKTPNDYSNMFTTKAFQYPWVTTTKVIGL